MKKLRRYALSMLLPGLLLTACSSEDDADIIEQVSGDTGGATLTVRPAAASAEDVTSVTVEVQPAGVTEAVSYDATLEAYTRTLMLPTGEQTFTVSAFDGWGSLIGQGSATATVVTNSTVAVMIQMQDVTGPADVPDRGPIITSVVVSNMSPLENETINMYASAVDVDGDPITYQWADNCTTSTFSAPVSPTTDWVNSTAGVCDVTITATSNGLSHTEAFAITTYTSDGDTGSASLTAYFIPHPVIEYITVYDSIDWGPVCSFSRWDTDVSCRATGLSDFVIFADVNYGTEQDDARTISLADDCGGSQTELYMDTAGSLGYGEWEWWHPVDDVCLVTVTATNYGLTDSFPIAIQTQAP